jgi:hypothetical protein
MCVYILGKGIILLPCKMEIWQFERDKSKTGKRKGRGEERRVFIWDRLRGVA